MRKKTRSFETLEVKKLMTADLGQFAVPADQTETAITSSEHLTPQDDAAAAAQGSSAEIKKFSKKILKTR